MHGVNTVEFAKKAGVTKARISAAIKQGVLKDSVTRVPGAGRGGNDAIFIDLQKGLAEWSANRDLARMPLTARAPSSRKGSRLLTEDAEKLKELQDNKAKRERFAALTAELDYRERAGELVLASDVEKEAFKRARIVRDAILNVPSKVSALLASMDDVHAVEELLTDHLTQALEDLGHAG